MMSFEIPFADSMYRILTSPHPAIADLSRAEWAILILTIAMVITLELVNTAAERIVDMVTEEYHPLAEKAKDIAAGAVLVGAVASVIVGICLFGTRVIE